MGSSYIEKKSSVLLLPSAAAMRFYFIYFINDPSSIDHPKNTTKSKKSFGIHIRTINAFKLLTTFKENFIGKKRFWFQLIRRIFQAKIVSW
jgi:hypothetical protein